MFALQIIQTLIRTVTACTAASTTGMKALSRETSAGAERGPWDEQMLGDIKMIV
jgi:hypothetical protein